MTSAGSTYSPGVWYSLVSPTLAVFTDPGVPGGRLDALWDVVLGQQGADAALAVIASGGPAELPWFGLAAVEPDGVRVVVRGELELTVQDQDGGERAVSGLGAVPWHDLPVGRPLAVWFARPGSSRDGIALPVVCGAVLADVLAWQPGQLPSLTRPGAGPGSSAVPARGSRPAPVDAGPPVPSAPVPMPSAQAAAPAADPLAGLVPPVAPAVPVGLAGPAAPAVEAPRTPARPADPAPMPPPAPAPVPARAASKAALPPVLTRPAEGDHDGRTRLITDPVPDPSPAAGVATPSRIGLLYLSTGEVVDVDGPVVIGRAPSQAREGETARLVAVRGPGRGISRTHVRVSVDGQQVQVEDLGSRNGTLVQLPSGPQVDLQAGEPFTLADGAIVTMAEVSFEYRALIDRD